VKRQGQTWGALAAGTMEKKTRAPDWGSANFNTAKLGRGDVSRTSGHKQAGIGGPAPPLEDDVGLPYSVRARGRCALPRSVSATDGYNYGE
jgi:hypothetical protein